MQDRADKDGKGVKEIVKNDHKFSSRWDVLTFALSKRKKEQKKRKKEKQQKKCVWMMSTKLIINNFMPWDSNISGKKEVTTCCLLDRVMCHVC